MHRMILFAIFVSIGIIGILTLSRFGTLNLALDHQAFADTTSSDSDTDGVSDTMDICVLVKGTIANHGCPELHVTDFSRILDTRLSADPIMSGSGSDRDGDSVDNTRDLCPTIGGSVANEGCPGVSPFSGLEKNQCLSEEFGTRGLMIAAPVCLVCPCDNAIEMKSLVRTCDILFPVILSRDQKTVYSRGSFFLIH